MAAKWPRVLLHPAHRQAWLLTCKRLVLQSVCVCAKRGSQRQRPAPRGRGGAAHKATPAATYPSPHFHFHSQHLACSDRCRALPPGQRMLRRQLLLPKVTALLRSKCSQQGAPSVGTQPTADHCPSN